MSKVAKVILGGVVLGALSVLTFGLAAPVFGSLATTISGITGLGAIASGAIAGGLVGGALSLLKPKIPELSEEFGRELQLNGDPVAPRKIVYGEAWTAGTLRYRNTTGADKKDLYLVIVLAGHEIDSVQEVEFDGNTVTISGSGDVTSPSKYSGLANVRFHLGDEDQVADNVLDSTFGNWDSDHRLRGLAYAVVKLTFDEENMNAIPQMRYRIRGRKVYDPRLDSTNGGSGAHRYNDHDTWEWSSNAVLCACDFVRGVKLVTGGSPATQKLIGGLGVSNNRIAWANVIAEANICEEQVSLSGGGTQDRYSVNGIIDPRQEHGQNLRHFEVAFAGDITFADGKWRFFAGAYRAPTLHLEDKHFIGPIRHIVHKGAAGRVDTAQGVFASEIQSGCAVDYPPVRLSSASPGSERVMQIDFALVNHFAQAQRCAKLLIEREAAGKTITCTTSLYGFRAVPGETIEVSHSAFGLAAQDMRVIDVQLTTIEQGEDKLGLAVELVLEAGPASLYSWNAEETEIEASPVIANEQVPLDPDEIHLVSDPFIKKGPSHWELGTGAFYVSGLGLNGTDVIEVEPSSTAAGFRTAARRGPSEFDVQAFDGMTIQLRWRSKLVSNIGGTWTSGFFARVILSDINGDNETIFQTSGSKVYTDSDTLDVWHEEVASITISDSSDEPMYIQIGLLMNKNLYGPNFYIDFLDAVITEGVSFKLESRESSAGVTPKNQSYPEGDIRRYGAALDGTTDDTAAAQTWLDVAGKIYGAEGTLRVTSQLELRDNTHIDGRWMKVVHDSTTEEHLFNGIRKDNITIERIEIDGNKSGKSFSGQASVTGIHLDASSNIKIDNCYIHDTYEHGISIGAVDFETAATTDSESEYISVTNCLIKDCGNSANGRGYGIWTFGIGYKINYSNNIVDECEAGGISVDDTSSGGTANRECFDVVMSDNVVYSTTTPASYIGIRFEGAQRGSITGNVSVSVAEEAFVLQSIQSDGVVGYVTISGNYFDGGTNAARIVDPTNVVFSDNVLVQNDHANNRGALYLWTNNSTQSTRLKVTDNLVVSADAGMVFGLAASHTTTMIGLEVSNNFLRYVGPATAASGQYGIYIEDIQAVEVTGNYVTHFYNGIHATATTADIRIAENRLTNNSNYGILLAGSGNKFVERNYTHSNTTAGLRIESSTNNFQTRIYDNRFLDGSDSASGFGSTTRQGNEGVGIGTSATATNISSSAAAINTTAKYAGKEVWDTTNNRRLVASGDQATDPWYVVDGSATVTPS